MEPLWTPSLARRLQYPRVLISQLALCLLDELGVAQLEPTLDVLRRLSAAEGPLLLRQGRGKIRGSQHVGRVGEYSALRAQRKGGIEWN